MTIRNSIIQRRGCAAFVILYAAFCGVAGTGQAEPSRYEGFAPSAKELARVQKLTPEHFAETVTIEDDELEPVATFTTLKGYKSGGWRFTDTVRSDNFLRAFVSKRTGAARYQLYETISYTGEWRMFRSANYASPDGPVHANLVVIDRDVSCQYGVCTYKEHVGFDLSEEQLRALAATYVPGASPLWRFRFKARSGLDWEDRMSPAEAAGMLAAVDRWRKDHGKAAQ
ncbi:MAG: hypothetical protein R3E04_03440 [Sphingobium sp.]